MNKLKYFKKLSCFALSSWAVMSSSFPSFRLTVNTKFFTFSFRTQPKGFLTQQTSNEENKKQTDQSCRCITNMFFIFITSGAKNKRMNRNCSVVTELSLEPLVHKPSSDIRTRARTVHVLMKPVRTARNEQN